MDFLDKYGAIIAEEINVKKVVPLDQHISYRKIYKPIGAMLKQYGADAGAIIAAGKKGQIQEITDQCIVVSDQGKEWTLTRDQYEIQYDGIDLMTVNVDGDMIVRLDTTLDQNLEQEGCMREICRLLNQMRKNANYQINQRVGCKVSCANQDILNMISLYEADLMTEALLGHIDYVHTIDTADVKDSFVYQQEHIYFALFS